MAYTTINKSTDHFNTKLYTGNGSTNAITGVGFQPDWTWIKNRSGSDSHSIYDAVRGVNKVLRSNNSDNEGTQTDGLTAFGTDGFTVGAAGSVNTNSNNFAAWNWKAGTGAGSSNTDGSINTTSTSVNSAAGFSISTYTGYGGASTVGHGLSAVPKMIIVKKRSGSSYDESWYVYHQALGNTHTLGLNSAGAASDVTVWNDTTPTSSVFSVGNDSTNRSGNLFVAYCFAEKTGYSKFGSYKGNGNANGTFIYLGFKPAWFLAKRTDGSDHWTLWDSKRETKVNPNDNVLFPSLNNAESASDTSYACDFLSNGIKWRGTSTGMNASGANYIYMAFAEAPLVGTNNIPATAR